jgi:uncharacterized lipoprotein YajG
MKNQINLSLFALLASLAAAGCATTPNPAIEAKIAKEPPVANRQELQNEASQMIQSDKDLSADQKQRLEILRTKLGAQLDEISAQSLKLRSVLVQDVLSPGYSVDEVDLIKKRLKKLEDKRLTLMFDGVDQANSILGRQAARHSHVMRELLEERATRE